MFHKRGPAAAKHRSPKLLFDRRTTHIAMSVDRSRRVLTSEVSWQSSARYAGAWPVRHCKTRTAILKVTRWRTTTGLVCHGRNLLMSILLALKQAQQICINLRTINTLWQTRGGSHSKYVLQCYISRRSVKPLSSGDMAVLRFLRHTVFLKLKF